MKGEQGKSITGPKDEAASGRRKRSIVSNTADVY